MADGAVVGGEIAPVAQTTVPMSALAKRRQKRKAAEALLTDDDRRRRVELMTTCNEARFNMMQKVCDGDEAYGDASDASQSEASPPPSEVTPPAPPAPPARRETGRFLRAKNASKNHPTSRIPDAFIAYLEGIQLEWIDSDAYVERYRAAEAADASVADERKICSGRAKLLRAFSDAFAEQRAFLVRLGRSSQCTRETTDDGRPLVRLDNDAVYPVENKRSELVIHAFFFIKHFRAIVHTCFDRYETTEFQAQFGACIERFLRKNEQTQLLELFFAEFYKTPASYSLYKAFTRSTELVARAFGARLEDFF